MVSLALGTSNGVEANNGINDLSPAPEAKKPVLGCVIKLVLSLRWF